MRPEEGEQIATINYLRLQYPTALYTIAPEGFKLPIGVAKKLKAMGYSSGTPDIMIFEPRKNYKGLFLEMKTPEKRDPLGKIYQRKGKLSDNQRTWLSELERRGYYARYCFGFEEAKVYIDWYFKVGE